ncbi:hypothetical protein BGZ76_003866 [Entomortierella beljakovae]|nr:hypothetical protein BGZ76_003866 [Entomortierella beljakovae]
MSSNSNVQDTSVTFHGWASTGTAELKQFSYHPRPIGPKDVELEISHCGICGSDIHTITSGWGELRLGPCIPGHEIIGKVVAKGSDAHFNLGDLVGVGAQVDSCGDCEECNTGFQPYCKKKAFTYNDQFKDGRVANTYGGYADRLRVNSDFAFKIPEKISAAEAAPLLCAGITTYAPLKRYGAGPGKKVGVIGIGGLGHLGLQWARAMGSDEVVAISSRDSKRDEAKTLGATKFVALSNAEEVKEAAASLDIAIVTSSSSHTDWKVILSLIATHGKLVLLALPETPLSFPGNALIGRGVTMVGSLIGGIPDIKEMLEFAAEKNVRPWIEKMPMSDANAAVSHMMTGHPRYRVVMETEAASRL